MDRDKHAPLYVSLDSQGALWVAQGRGLPSATGQSALGFLRSDRAASLKEVRVAGFLENAKLVLELYRRKIKGRLDRAMICSPLAVAKDGRPPAPEVALAKMRIVSLPVACGGWREIGPADAAAFRLALATEKDDLEELCRQHVVYDHAAFVDDLDERALGEIIAKVIDPRWRLFEADPDDRTGLYRMFGLLDGRPSVRPEVEARVAVLRAAGIGRPGGLERSTGPGGYFARLGKERPLFAARRFFDFLIDGWLDRLSFTHKGMYFAPDIFFHDDEIAAAACKARLARGAPG